MFMLVVLLMVPISTAFSADTPMSLVVMASKSAPHANTANTTPSLQTDAVKWHPGHYVTLAPFASDGPGYFDEVLNEISRHPALRGVQKRYLWADLEKQAGRYDFSAIENDLARLAGRGKRLVILPPTKSFKSDIHVVPQGLARQPGCQPHAAAIGIQ
jgi:hypothetical protein